MKKFFGKTVLVFVIALVTFIAQSAEVIPPNSVDQTVLRNAPMFTTILPDHYGPGLRWRDPGLDSWKLYLNTALPTTDDYMKLALYSHAQFVNLRQHDLKKYGNLSPKTKAGMRQLVEDIVAYYKATPRLRGAIYPDFVVNGTRFFTPEKGTGRYDVELAHFARIRFDKWGTPVRTATGAYVVDNSVYFNEKAWRAFVTENKKPIMGIVAHEVGHGALGFTAGPLMTFFQETINQTITLVVLDSMCQDSYPMACTAFWGHLRDMAFYSAKYRAYWADGEAAISLANADWQTQWWARQQKKGSIEVGFRAPEKSVYVADPVKIVKSLLTGRWYGDLETKTWLPDTPTYRLTLKLNQLGHQIQADGIHLQPTRWVMEKTSYNPLVIRILRRVFGAGYAHVEWVLREGEKDRFARLDAWVYGGETRHLREFNEKWADQNTYFGGTWWQYEYAPLSVIISNYYYGLPIRWMGAETDDFNDILRVTWGTFSRYFTRREVSFEGDRWGGLLGVMALKPYNVKYLAQAENCEYYEDTDATFCEPRKGWGPRAFPTIPLAAALVLFVVWPLTTGGLKRFYAGASDFAGVELTL